SLDGITVLNANNRYQKDDLMISPNTPTEIICNLGNVPLMEGQYSLSIYLGDESKDHHIVENAIILQVYERDIWGNGKVPPQKISALWWSTQFYSAPIFATI